MNESWKRTAGALLVLMTTAAPAWADPAVIPIKADFLMEIPATRPLPPRVTVNGQTVQFDQGPVMEDGLLLLPLRAVVEAAGGTVSWDGETRAVTVRLPGRTAIFAIGQEEAELMEEGVLYLQPNLIRMERAATIIQGRTLISADALTSILGLRERPDRDLNLDLFSRRDEELAQRLEWPDAPRELREWAGTVGESSGSKAIASKDGTYLAIAGGMQNSGGWTIEILSVTARKDGGWLLSVELLPPDGPATMALTNPVAYFFLPGLQGDLEVQFTAPTTPGVKE